MTRFAARHPVFRVVVGAALVAALVLFWRYGVRDNLVPRNFGVVEAGVLYRSGRLTPAATEKVVRENGIRTIVDLGAFEPDSPDERIAQRTAEALHVPRTRFSLMGDATGDPAMYVQALRIITDPKNQPVLVHCAAGTQRTGACVMLYRKLTKGTEFDESLAEAASYKHDPRDNPKLIEYLRKNGDAILAEVRSSAAAEAHPK